MGHTACPMGHGRQALVPKSPWPRPWPRQFWGQGLGLTGGMTYGPLACPMSFGMSCVPRPMAYGPIPMGESNKINPHHAESSNIIHKLSLGDLGGSYSRLFLDRQFLL